MINPEKKDIKPLMIIEVIWLVVSLLGFGAAIIQFANNNIENSIKLGAVALLCFLMYMMRRYYRKISKTKE